jgi:signal transduction histidine kinase
MHQVAATHWQELLTRSVPEDSRFHLVQFYEDLEFLTQAVGQFVIAGLMHGDAVIVIARRSHIESFQNELMRQNISYRKGVLSQQLIFLDADQILSRVMHDCVLNEDLFTREIQKIFKNALRLHPRIRIYGEIVDILRCEKNFDGVIQLEEFWNKLSQFFPLSVLCSYWIKGFNCQTLNHVFDQVCRNHTHVLPAETITCLTDQNSRNRTIAKLQQQANLLQSEIEERHRVERELYESEIKLKEAIRIRDEFITIASHECRTPVTSLKLQLHMASRQVNEKGNSLDIEKFKRFLDTSSRQVIRLAGLIEDMLDISRIEQGKLIIRRERMNLSTIIRCAVDELDEQLKMANCPVMLELDESIEGCWDSYRLEQVVINLLTNAMKYASGKPVHIVLRRKENSALLSVADKGMGIQSNDLERIFQRFERAISHSYVSGLGLGLFISKQIVEAHHGLIRVESQLEKGSTFTVELPLEPDQVESQSA